MTRIERMNADKCSVASWDCWKSYTANEINKRESCSEKLWMHESYNHIVRNEESINYIRNYINQNPVKAGITVSEASSF